MASQPPAGYNPEASLLQGGTAPIVAVQGGGGMEAGAVPSGYNPETSLLNTGHNAPIIAVKGGSLDSPTAQEGGKGGEAYAEYVIEQYKPTLASIPPIGIPPANILWKVADDYTTAMLSRTKELKTFVTDPNNKYSEDSVLPYYNICTKDGKKSKLQPLFFQLVRKRYVLIDIENPIIYIIPNIKGNTSLFLQYMNFILKESKLLPPNTFVIFTGSFFLETGENEKNVPLYYEFLKLKNKNIDNLYYINDLTPSFVNTGCFLLSRFSSTAPGEYKQLITFFEPDIILFQKQHIFFENSKPTVSKNDPDVKLSEVLNLLKKPEVNKNIYKTFTLNPSLKGFDTFAPHYSKKPEEEKYFIFNYGSEAEPIEMPIKTDILCPKDNKCFGFQAGYKLINLEDNRALETTSLYVISKNTDKMPFLKEEGSKLTQEELDYIEGKKSEKEKEPLKKVSFVNEEDVKSVEEEEEEEEEEEKEEEEEEVATPLEEAFKEDPSAVKTDEIEIELNAKVYKIRVAFMDGVSEDWEKGKFTKDEARLLNALQFSPKLLSNVFGEEKWSFRLVDFLTSLLSSKCFNDFTLLTSAECSNAEEFVKQVYFGLFTQTLNEMYDEFGVPKPKKLGELVTMLKKVGKEKDLEDTEDKEEKIKEFTKYNFTGDILDRFHVIKYDPKTAKYYTDFAEINEATRKLLNDLTFQRFESTNYEEIKDIILKTFTPKLNSSLLPSQEQCMVVRNYITKTFEREFLVANIETFLKSDSEAKSQNITLDVFKECVAAVNAELGLDYFKIKESYTGQLVPEVEYEIKDVRGDGWCFYHSLLQSVGEEPDYAILSNDVAKKDTSDDAEVTAFLSKIKAAIQNSSQKNEWEKLYNIVYGKGKYATYLQDLNDPTKKVWADPDFGIGQMSANELKATIEIYRVVNGNYSLIVTYKPNVVTDPTRIIRLHYVNNNHYQILLKKMVTQGGGEEIFDLGDPIQEGGEIFDLGDSIFIKMRKNKTRKNRSK